MSNLTVTYVSQTPAGTPAGPSAAATAADSPLGFLGALLDQILDGGIEASIGGKTADAGANIDLPGLLNVALGTRTDAPSVKATQPSNLLAALSLQLDKLQAQTDAPPSGQLARLSDSIDALIAALGPSTSAPTPASTPPGPITTSTQTARTASFSDQQITQLLSKLGLIDAPSSDAIEEVAPVSVLAVTVEPKVDVAALRERLVALSQSLTATAPDLAQRLQTLAARLEPIAASPELAAQLGIEPPPADPDALTIAQIVRTLLGHPPAADATPDTTSTAGTQPATAATPSPQAESDLLRVLATLGLETTPPPASSTGASAAAAAATPSSSSVAAVPEPLLRLSTQLGQIATELATTAPDLAKKLEAVATRIVSADAGPELLGKLTSAAAQPDDAALDQIVKSLIEPRPIPTPAPAAPQIAVPKELTLPAPIAPTRSKSVVTEVKAAPPEPAPVTADSGPKPAPAVTLAATARDAGNTPAPDSKVDAKVAAVVADATGPEPAAQPAQAQIAVAAQQARALPAAYQAVATPINMGQVAFEMARQMHQGTSRFTIRLDPPELGRVDVRMHVDASGALNARLTVDRAETLDLFQRDQRTLERALAQAGLDSSKTTLEFSLRQQNHNPFAGMMGGDQRQNQQNYGGAPRLGPPGSDEVAALPAITLYRGTASAGGVNIFA